MTQWLPWLALGLAVAALILALLALVAGSRRWQRELQGRDEQIADKEARLARLEQEFAELRRGSQGMVKLIRELRDEVRNLGQKQEQMEFNDPEARLYNRAVKLLQQGAGLEEIMEACELPRAEAELLMRIHGR
ncbi:MAG: DUF2802 domain-containing protein [Gammaproteobacteria bacterium]|nr:DUF2802 domain-containing protein [Gammaproteobacteria bacterium]